MATLPTGRVFIMIDGQLLELTDPQYVENLIRGGWGMFTEKGLAWQIIPWQNTFLLNGCPVHRVMSGVYDVGEREALNAAGFACILDPPAPPPEPPPTTNTPGLEITAVPDVKPFIAVPTGEPVTTVVITIVASVIGALGRIFGGGVPKAVVQQLASMRDAIVQLGKELLRLSQLLAFGLQQILRALDWIHRQVISRIINKIATINARIAAIIDRILKPYLDLLQRIRQVILDIYVRFFMPIIELLQMFRQALAFLRLLHIPGIDKLDQKIQRIQARLIGVITDILGRLNDHSGLLNILLTLRNTLQYDVLLSSLYENRFSWISLWWNEQTPSEVTLSNPFPPPATMEATQVKVQDEVSQLARTGGGPMAATIAPGVDSFRRAVNASNQPQFGTRGE